MDYRPMVYSLPNPNSENGLSSSGKILIFTWERNQTIFTVFPRVILTPLLSIRKINHLESLKGISLVHQQDFPKVSVYNAGDLGSIPGSGRFPGGGNGNPLQYSCLESPMDGGVWCRLLSMGSQRVRHDWATSLSFFLSSSPWWRGGDRGLGKGHKSWDSPTSEDQALRGCLNSRRMHKTKNTSFPMDFPPSI